MVRPVILDKAHWTGFLSLTDLILHRRETLSARKHRPDESLEVCRWPESRRRHDHLLHPQGLRHGHIPVQSEEDPRHRLQKSHFSGAGWGLAHSLSLLTCSGALIKLLGFCCTGSLHPNMPLSSSRSGWHDWNGRWGGCSLFTPAFCFPLLTSAQPRHLVCREPQWFPLSRKTPVQCCDPLRVQCNYNLGFLDLEADSILFQFCYFLQPL